MYHWVNLHYQRAIVVDERVFYSEQFQSAKTECTTPQQDALHLLKLSSTGEPWLSGAAQALKLGLVNKCATFNGAGTLAAVVVEVQVGIH